MSGIIKGKSSRDQGKVNLTVCDSDGTISPKVVDLIACLTAISLLGNTLKEFIDY